MRIGVIGNLAGSGYIVVKALRQSDVDATLLMSTREKGTSSVEWEREEINVSWISYTDKIPFLQWLQKKGEDNRSLNIVHKAISTVLIIRELRKFDIIISCAMYSILAMFSGKPYIAYALGSDLRELAVEGSFMGRLMLRAFLGAKQVWIGSFDFFPMADNLGMANAIFMPMAIDQVKYGVDSKMNERKESELVIFHPTNLDWTEKENRWTKGNDKFIRAFARFVRDGNKARLVLLFRGPDKVKAKELVEELSIAGTVIFASEMTKDLLIQQYRAADAIADQFEIGCLGLIALEAMASGRPVLVYVNIENAKRAYPDMPPVLNCFSEEEIYSALIDVTNTIKRNELGEASIEWIGKYHNQDAVGKIMAKSIKNICVSSSHNNYRGEPTNE